MNQVETLALEAVASDGQVIATQLIRAEGKTLAPVELLPHMTDLGSRPLGSRTRGKVAIVAREDGVVEVLEVKSTDHTARIIPSPAQVPSVVEFEIVVHALEYGESSETISVRHNRSTTYTLRHRLRWYGVKPEFEK